MTAVLLSLLTISLWPQGPPGPKMSTAPERDTTTSRDNNVGGRSLIRLGPVTEPSLTFYPAPNSTKPAPAVLVFPGGGYRILAYDLEGTEICDWLNHIGFAAVLVKYRVSEPGGPGQYQLSLQDAQRAMGIVRSHAGEWRIDPHRTGVLGFSAGGHLSAVLSNSEGARTYPALDAADQESSRPDFTVLIYPAYLETLTVKEKTPPVFIVQAENDKPFIDGTLHYYSALKAAGIPADLHVYATGGHGYGLRLTAEPVTGWPALAGAWLQRLTAPQ